MDYKIKFYFVRVLWTWIICKLTYVFTSEIIYLRHFDPFDDSDDDYPSFGSGAPSGLDTNSAKAVRASGQVVSQIDRYKISLVVVLLVVSTLTVLRLSGLLDR